MKSLERLLTRASNADPRAVDIAVAVVLTVGSLITTAASNHHGPIALLSAAALCATVAWRRQAPAVTTLVAVVAITIYEQAGASKSMTLEPLAALLNFYMLGRLPRDGARRWVDAGLLALAIGAITLSPGNSHVIDVLGTWGLFVVLPFAAGRAIASRTALTSELRANAERLEREQEERARRAAAEERNRIARELHDVVAHSVSVMVIQTQAARRVAGADRDAAREALRSVEACGREALSELRRMMGTVRHGDTELAGTAAPGLSQLDGLVARARAAGLPVELRVEGERHELSPGVDLVAYRVVQEALTNTIKHAGPARARVILTFGRESLELEITDTGRGPEAADDHDDAGGHGLLGMRERLALFGGELHTGKGRAGGFEVRARIPISEAVPA